jgi:hypothetical protein
MKVFVSWSGERSQALAQALRDWRELLHLLEREEMFIESSGSGSSKEK